jgi:hypothetical protein
MDGIEKFLQLHRQRLLAYLDGIAPESPEEPGPKEFVEQVLEDWSRLSAGKKVGSAAPEGENVLVCLVSTRRAGGVPRAR